jgi:hypothetical protein
MMSRCRLTFGLFLNLLKISSDWPFTKLSIFLMMGEKVVRISSLSIFSFPRASHKEVNGGLRGELHGSSSLGSFATASPRGLLAALRKVYQPISRLVLELWFDSMLPIVIQELADVRFTDSSPRCGCDFRFNESQELVVEKDTSVQPPLDDDTS